jgi:hypothetical protein
MNGFEQIKSFYSWVFNNQDKARTSHISLYMFLLNQNNRSMWVEWFKCPYDLAMQGACIGNKNTYYKALNELQSFGLIEHQKGINGYKAPLIKLIKLYDCDTSTTTANVPLSAPLTVPVTEPLSVLLNKNTYKLITNNYKLVNNNINEWLKNTDENTTNLDKLNNYRMFNHLKLSFQEFDKLNSEYSKELIDSVLDKIENYKKNTSYKSLYLTASTWLKKEKPEEIKEKYVAGRQTQTTLVNTFNNLMKNAK